MVICRKLVKICKPRLIFMKLGFIITMNTVNFVIIIIITIIIIIILCYVNVVFLFRSSSVIGSY
jgi:hypothetical protein